MNGRALLGLIGGAGVLAIVAAGVLPSLRSLGGTERVATYEVSRQDFLRRITAEGNLKAVKATPLSAPVASRGPYKVAWLLPDGSRVRAGDVVVRFDPTDKEREVADGRADRESADRRIEKKKTEDGAMLRNLGRDSEQARLQLEQAQAFPSKDPLIFSRVEIIESQIDESLANQRVSHSEATRKTREELSRTDVELLAIERRKADVKVRQAEDALRSLEIVAPHDGILTYRRDWRGETPRVGESVWSGEPVAEIPELDEMEAEVFVLEADAGGLAVGLPATVYLEAEPETKHRAKVKRLDSLARPRFRGSPVQYFSLVLELEKTDPTIMKPGQRVRADLVLDERQDALVVPREAVQERDGKKVVFRKRGTRFESVEVTLGPSALGRVVVERGIEEGDVVALGDPTRRAGEDADKGSQPSTPPAPRAGGPS